VADPNLPSWAQKKRSGSRTRARAPRVDSNLPSWARNQAQAQSQAPTPRGAVILPSSSKAHHHRGFFGNIVHTAGETATNLGKGAENAVIGLPNTVVTTSKAVGHDVARGLSPSHPWLREAAHGRSPIPETTKKVLKPLAKSYAYKYGPLVLHGDIGKTYHRAVTKDLFGTILDGATFLAGGSAVAGKLLPAEASALRELPLRGPAALAKAGKLKGPKSIRPVDEPLVVGGRAVRGLAIRHTLTHKALNTLPANTPLVGELRRFNHELNRIPRREAAARRLQAIPLDRAMHKLSAHEKAATALVARWPLPRLLDAQINKWKALEAEGHDVGALKIATDPKIRALYDAPKPKMLAALEEARKLGHGDAKLLDEYGQLSADAASQVPWLHMRMASGAKFIEETPGRLGIPSKPLRTARAYTARLQALYDKSVAREQDLGFTAHQQKMLGGEPGAPVDATALREQLRPMEASLRKLTALHNEPVANLLEERAVHNRLLRLGNSASAEVAKFAKQAGTSGEVAGLEELQARVEAMTEHIKEIRGAPPEAIVELRKEVAAIRKQIRAAEAPRPLKVGGERPYALTPQGRPVYPIGRERSNRLGGALSVSKENLARLEAIAEKAKSPTGVVGGDSIDALRAELAKEGRPEPAYLHDTSIHEPSKTEVETRAAGGGTSPVPQSGVHQNQGVLAAMGRVILDPGTLLSQHFRTIKYALYRDIHQTLESAAVEVPHGVSLPDKGWEYLRRAEGIKGKTGETIPYTERTAGAYQDWVEQTLGSAKEEAQLGEKLTTADAGEAATSATGHRLMVPKSMVDQLTGEFTRSSKATRNFIEKPLDIWRTILLNYSPRWLLNNVIGNTFMSLVRFGGPTFIKQWLTAVMEKQGPGMIDQLFKDKAAKYLTASDRAELAPENFTGTFKGQNLPFSHSPFESKAWGRAKEMLAPVDRGYEQKLRGAAFNTQVMKSPEAKALYNEMPKQTRSWRAASRQALEQNPALVKKITQEVESGLGNFTGMSAAERNWIRRVVPFYAWYRAILGVVVKLPLEAPLRVNILAHLAQIQQEDQDMMNPDLPSWLRGSVPVGGGGLLTMQGLNPYGTVPQVGRQVVNDPLGTTMPFLQAIAGTGRTFYQPTSAYKLGRALLGGPYGTLPPIQAYQLATKGARPSKVYDARTLDQLLSLIGVPLRHPTTPLKHR
jgi:hypothetical protein